MKTMVRVLVTALGMLVGCAAEQPQARPRANAGRPVQRLRNRSEADGSRCDSRLPGRSASEADTNADGVPDVRRVYQSQGEGSEVRTVLVCREADLNHDGRKDVFRFYNDEGRVRSEEEDRDFDGRIDVVTYFENGEVVRREEDTTADGVIDMRTYFQDHRAIRTERMEHPTGTEFHADYWEYYDPQGHVVRMGRDLDGDGRADQWFRTDRISPTRGASTAVPGAAPTAPPGALPGAPTTGAVGATTAPAPAAPPATSTPPASVPAS